MNIGRQLLDRFKVVALTPHLSIVFLLLFLLLFVLLVWLIGSFSTVNILHFFLFFIIVGWRRESVIFYYSLCIRIPKNVVTSYQLISREFYFHLTLGRGNITVVAWSECLGFVD